MNEQNFRELMRNLLERYISYFPTEEHKLAVVREQFRINDDLRSRTTLPGHFTASALIFRPVDRCILLIRHRQLDAWTQPGGHIELAETPIDAAFRESQEETSLTELKLHEWHLRSLIPIHIDVHTIPANKERGEPPHQHFDCRYVFMHLAKETVAINAEATAYTWLGIDRLASLSVFEGLAQALKNVQAQILDLSTWGTLRDP